MMVVLFWLTTRYFCNRRNNYSINKSISTNWVWLVLLLLSSLVFHSIHRHRHWDSAAVVVVTAYRHEPCTRAARAQFQFPDCYLPPLNENLLLSEASFLMSHNAATSYIHPNTLSKTGLSWRYSQNQALGSVYEQLQDGARALDVRPLLLWNGTVILQHGAIRIPVTLETLVRDAVRWCHDHPDELVLLLPSHFAYQTTTYKFRQRNSVDDDGDDDDVTDAYFDYQGEGNFYDDDDLVTDDGAQSATGDMTTQIAKILADLGVSYFTCSDVYEMTVAQAMALASPGTGKGYLLVLDSHDYYGTSCGKENWIESKLVTCYTCKISDNNNKTLPCTKSDLPWQNLHNYIVASANNPATDSFYELGPPATLYKTPFNVIQALWQVDTNAAMAGLAHFSSILQDNRQSRVNELVMDLVYRGDALNAISLLAVDNVALNGNALTSVLRNQCGQQQQQQQNLPCGTNLEPPRLTYVHWTTRQCIGLVAVLYSVWLVYSVVAYQRPRILYTAYARCRTEWQDYQQRQQSQQYYLDRKEDLLVVGQTDDV